MVAGKTDWKPGNVTKGYRDGYDAMKWGNASKEPCCSDDECCDTEGENPCLCSKE